MIDKNKVYHEQILPLVRQIYAIAEQSGVSCSMVFQASDVDLWQTHLISKQASDEMKQSADWWLQNVDAKVIEHG